MEGDLTESEEAEWIGRLRARLEIPCGEFILQAFGQACEIQEATTHDLAPNPHAVHFVKVKLPPGSYLVEVYAFVSSTTVNDFWNGPDGVDEVVRWWQRSRPGTEPPPWLEGYRRDGYVQTEQGLLEYLIRLTPARGDIPLPRQEGEFGLCGVLAGAPAGALPVGHCARHRCVTGVAAVTHRRFAAQGYARSWAEAPVVPQAGKAASR